ncbi:methyltransferase domain-containing protein [Streptomyces sp. NPDC060131]|uniref:methyltransferase domain-containing protein n=1 Tax=unclassified Streptomyces TaxID=2593676 RepID=UPI00365A97EE
MTHAKTARRAMVSALEEAGTLPLGWRDSFLGVPRHLFLPDVFWATEDGGDAECAASRDADRWMRLAHSDVPIVTQWDDGEGDGREVPTSSASMPTMVAAMLGDLDVEVGMTAREIGTGTGYNAGLLAHLLGDGNVTTVEVDGGVAARARRVLRDAGLRPRVLHADGAGESLPAERYDRLIATCSVLRVPGAWIRQCRPGGVIVTPVSTLFGDGAIARLVVGGDGSASGTFTRSSAFMRLRRQRYRAPSVDDYLPGEWPGGAPRESTSLDPETFRGSWLTFLLGLLVPDLYYRRSPEGDGWTWWFFDTGVTSWAMVDSLRGAESFEVRQSGPRRLWDEIEAAHRWWVARGRPGLERFGLTVTADDEHRVRLDDPGDALRPASGSGVPGGPCRRSGG